MKNFSKSSTSIEIRLNEEKFYFPKQPIEGVVQVHPKKPTKANHIRLTFTGEIFLAIKEKETINLFTYAENLPMSKSGKTQVLEAKQHEFPFKFVVPNDLPSTFQFRRPKAWIKYTLTAVLYRPMMMEALSAKTTYPIQILEFIDVESREFAIPREQNLDFSLQDSKLGQQCHLKVTMPKIGYTRGDVVKLGIVLSHYEPTVRKEGIKVELMRMVGIQTAKNAHSGEEVLKDQWYDINITGPYNFKQAFDAQIIIPTSTPPSIMYKGLAVQFYYRIRVGIYLNNDTKNKVESHRVDMPIIVGTWPKADIPIDDEDEDTMPWETTDEEDSMSDSHFSSPQPMPSRSTSMPPPSQPRRNTGSSSFVPGTISPVSTITLGMRNITTPNTPANLTTTPIANGAATVARSDSNVSHSSDKSRDSIGSHRSNQSYYTNPRSPTLSFSTHGSANFTSPDSLHHPTTGLCSPSNNCSLNPANPQAYYPLNRSSSTPELANIVSPPGSNIVYGNTNSTVVGHRSSLYDSTSSSTPVSNYSNNQNVVSLQPVFAQALTQPQHQNHVRVTSMELVTTPKTTITPTTVMGSIGRAAGAVNVQPRVLQPISSSTGAVMYHTTQFSPTTTPVPLTSVSPPTVTNLIPRIHRTQNDVAITFDSTDVDPGSVATRTGTDISSSEESDGEDLLRIIERKKKLEERAKRSSFHRNHVLE